MPRGMPAGLLAEQKKGPGTVPHVQVKLVDDPLTTIHEVWTRWYTGSETLSIFDATITDTTKSLHRVWRDPDGGPDVNYSRVLLPTAASNYNNWVQWITTGLNVKAIAIDARLDVIVRLQTNSNASPDRFLWEESTDDGDNWTILANAITGRTNITHLAVTVFTSGNAVAIFADNGEVYCARLDDSVWEAPIQLSALNPNSITGVAITNESGANNDCVITGTDSDGNAALWTVIFGNDGEGSPAEDVFSTPLLIESAVTGSDVAYTYPTVAFLDSMRIWFIEAFTGTVSHNQPLETWTAEDPAFKAPNWKEPRPFNYSTAYGLKAIAWSDGTLFGSLLISADAVWFTPAHVSDIDLTDDVLEVDLRAQVSSGGCTLTLRNDDGKFNNLPNSAFPLIDNGFGFEVSPGYKINGIATVPAEEIPFTIKDWRYDVQGGRSVLIIEGMDRWERLSRWRARRQFQWDLDEKNVRQIMSVIVGRVPLELSNINVSTFSGQYAPAFTINVGEDGRTLVLRLLSRIVDKVRSTQSAMSLTEFKTDDSSDDTYGISGELPVLRGKFDNGRMPWNHIRVHGASDRFDEAFDYSDIDTNQEEPRTVKDLSLTTSALVTSRTVAELRNAVQARIRGHFVSYMNCKVTLWDVVTVTAPKAGIDAVNYRVLGADFLYRRERKPVYEQTLVLGDL